MNDTHSRICCCIHGICYRVVDTLLFLLLNFKTPSALSNKFESSLVNFEIMELL